MKKTYTEPQSYIYEICDEDMITTSLTGKAEGLRYGGASTFGDGEDVGGDTKERVDFSEDIDLTW